VEKNLKKIFLGTVALMALAVPATAADLAARPYTKAPPPAAYAPIYNWTGFYIGGHVGGAFGSSNNLFNSSSDDGRFLGGVQGGFDYQMSPNWVVGLEAQYSWLSDTTWIATNAALESIEQRKRGLGSVTGRLGYTWGPGLLYVKGGYAFADISTAAFDGAGVPVAVSTNKDGWTIGAGLEYMFAPNWSAKVEYQYYDLGNSSAAFALPTGTVSWRNDEHTVKAGINYRFNTAAPVVARY
jgi:outer membrane immunogenic protein